MEAGMKKSSMVATALVIAVVTSAQPAGADEAKGTGTYKDKPVVTFKHAYLMKGPDPVTNKVIRRLVLSVVDVSAALKGCATMMCSDGGIEEGMTVDFDAGPRLNYWFVANGQRIQYSGTAEPSVAKLTTDAPGRLAGTLKIDGRSAGGPLVDVTFDAALVKELKK
jgi:hypothetical protein